MNKFVLFTAIALLPVAAMAEHPEGTVIDDIQSEIRDDYRQLSEDKDLGNVEAVRQDQRDIAEDKMRLSEAKQHPNDKPPLRRAERDQENLETSSGDMNAYPDKSITRPDVPRAELDNPGETSTESFDHAAHVDSQWEDK